MSELNRKSAIKVFACGLNGSTVNLWQGNVKPTDRQRGPAIKYSIKIFAAMKIAGVFCD